MTSTVPSRPINVSEQPWRDPSRSTSERVRALMEHMTLEEKVAQLYGVWIAASSEGGDVAPHQHDMSEDIDLDELLPAGLGQLTRPFGSAPVDAAVGALSLARTQTRIIDSNRFAIPALAHEECLAGFAAWGATAYPIPLAWGATFSPELIETMAARIGADMRSVGIHQGLAPVLDVVRDARWGRVEETIGEDPYLVGTIASAYIRGLESTGVIATLKHFVGYSASRAGRNLAPVSVGRRELADVLLPPFEMAVRAGVGSVMNSYSDIDGVPTAADDALLTTLLRDEWGFEGTVVADYFSIGFLRLLHNTADTWAQAAHQALFAGIDVELPTVRAYGSHLVVAVEEGDIDVALVDRALERVLRQKVELGLLDPDYDPTPEALRHVLDERDLGGVEGVGDSVEGLRGSIDLDPDENRAVARQIAEKSLILLTNDGILPLKRPAKIAVIGPNAQDPFAVLGCYSFPAHVGVQHPGTPIGIELPTVREALQEEFPDAEITYELGTSIDGAETDGFDAAASAASDADVVVLALGDRAGLFGRGTSGEGCDVADLTLPGAQLQLLETVLNTGTPTVVALLSGRPYWLGSAPDRASAIVSAFFAGEEGTTALAGLLSGRINPSGRLPVSIPGSPGVHPSTYLAAPLAEQSGVSNLDPTPRFWFGHGLSYTTFEWTNAAVSPENVATNGSVSAAITVTNTGDRPGAEVVQLYLRDPVSSVVLPTRRLIGFARVELQAGEQARVTFEVPSDLMSFTGRDYTRIVEPGEMSLCFGEDANTFVAECEFTLTGPTRRVDHLRQLHPRVVVEK